MYCSVSTLTLWAVCGPSPGGAVQGTRESEALPRVSPTCILSSPGFVQARAARNLPAMTLLHGTADQSMPCTQTAEFAAALQGSGVPVDVRYYEHKSHTDPIIEDPVRGGRDPLLEDIVALATSDPQLEGQEPPLGTQLPPRPPMLPGGLVYLARLVAPF